MADKKFERIVLHCSDSEFGHALMIREWHIQRGFSTVGYHCIILNGFPTADWYKNKIMVPYLDGSVEWGREVDSDEWFEGHEIGAHVKNFNTGSLSVCMIGKEKFSTSVLNSALKVIRFHMKQFGLGAESVVGHYELNPDKTCPNIEMKTFRQHLVDNTNYGETAKEEKKEEPKEEAMDFGWLKMLGRFLKNNF